MKFQGVRPQHRGGTAFSIEANTAQEALGKAIAEIGATYPAVEIAEWQDLQQMPQTGAYRNQLSPGPKILASGRVGNPMNPYFPHLPL